MAKPGVISERLTIWFPLALLAILAGLTWWLDGYVKSPAAARGAAGHDPDYIVNDITAIRFDENGKPRHTLFARKMTHYGDNDTTLLEAPRFITTDAARAPVTVTSRTARLTGRADNVYFHDDVKVVRAAYQNQSEMTLTTNYLHVIPDEDIARTNQPVRVVDANTVVTANGLELNNKTRILQLQGRVRGTYHDVKKQGRGVAR